MGQILNGGPNGTELHRCSDERPHYGYTHGDGSTRASEQPYGIIFRCSCGKLWKTRYETIFPGSYTVWRKAGPWLRMRYRNQGVEDSHGSSY